MAVPAPPFVRCHGIRLSTAKALNGLYEQSGVWGNHAAYRQAGISSGNNLWFAEDMDTGPGWVITQKAATIGVLSSVIAFVPSHSAWPWEVDACWHVCGRDGAFAPCPNMAFSLYLPVPELLLHGELEPGGPTLHRFRKDADVNDRLCYRRVPEVPADVADVRLFYMPVSGRWMLAQLKDALDEEGGVEMVFARSVPDSGCTWASIFPWAVEYGAWEKATTPTIGFVEVDTAFWPDPNMKVSLISPPVFVDVGDEEVPLKFSGTYEPRGMMNGRVFYVLQSKEATCLGGAGPTALWYAEDRGQWVVSRPEKISSSGEVFARVRSKAFWPWEAHLGGSTSPCVIGAVPLEIAPPWERGASIMLASNRSAWEVEKSYAIGSLEPSKAMSVKLDVPRQMRMRGAPKMRFRFLGDYEYAGFLSSRPFFLQTLDEDHREESVSEVIRSDGQVLAKVVPRCVVWFEEERNQWVITADYRLLDGTVVDARVQDSAWLPWEIHKEWDVPDGEGTFLRCPGLGSIALEEPESSLEEEEENDEEDEEVEEDEIARPGTATDAVPEL